MEVENHLFVVENGLPFGAIVHFHVSSRECIVGLLVMFACCNVQNIRRVLMAEPLHK